MENKELPEKKFPDSISMDNMTKWMLSDMSVVDGRFKSKYIRALIAADYEKGGKIATKVLKEVTK